MIPFLIILALIVLAIFGIGFIVDSAAHANEAQAVIETARIGQVQAANNLMGTLILAIVVLALLSVIVMIFIVALRSRNNTPSDGRSNIRTLPKEPKERPAQMSSPAHKALIPLTQWPDEFLDEVSLEEFTWPDMDVK